jgi:hypothetical protein
MVTLCIIMGQMIHVLPWDLVVHALLQGETKK